MITLDKIKKMTSQNIRVDLHLHSSASDGTWDPETLVSKAYQSGIQLFTLSDHDTTENISATAKLAQQYGLHFIPGVEINVSVKERKFHILGLGIETETPALQSLLEKNRHLTESFDEESIKYLEREFPHISYADYRKYKSPSERGGWKALNYLIDRNICQNEKDFFKLFQTLASPYDDVIYCSPREAIQAIEAAGGIAILAHPGSHSYGSDYQSVVDFMIEEGIHGIECFHPDNRPEVTEYCVNLCRKKGLFITGGSDCHGTFVSSRSIGSPEIYLSQLKLE